jgi:hypothetical protein
VHALHDAGVHFAVTSGRPPRGMEMLVAPPTGSSATRTGRMSNANRTPCSSSRVSSRASAA